MSDYSFDPEQDPLDLQPGGDTNQDGSDFFSDPTHVGQYYESLLELGSAEDAPEWLDQTSLAKAYDYYIQSQGPGYKDWTRDDFGAGLTEGMELPPAEQMTEWDRRQNYATEYWANPQRVATYKQTIDSLPDDAAVPAFLDKDTINGAYRYFTDKYGTDWTAWPKNLPKSDPFLPVLQKMQEPQAADKMPWELRTAGGAAMPDVSQMTLSQFQAWMDEQKTSDPATYSRVVNSLADQAESESGGTDWLGMPNEVDPNLPLWQYPAAALFNTQVGRVGSQAGLGLLMGGLGGAALGAGLGVWGEAENAAAQEAAAKGEEFTPNALLAAMNVPFEAANKTLGALTQLIAASIDPEHYGTVGEVIDNLGAAGEASKGFSQMAGVSFLSQATSQELIMAQAMRAAGMSEEDIAGVFGRRATPTIDPSRLEVWQLGKAKPTVINAPDGQWALPWMLTQARREYTDMVKNGAGLEQAEEAVYSKYGQMVGFTGQASEMAAGLLDPIDLIPGAVKFVGAKAAKRAGNVPLVRAFEISAGPLEAVKTYGELLKVEKTQSELAGMDGFSRFLAGVDAEGKPSLLNNIEKPKTALEAIPYVFQKIVEKTPGTKANEVTIRAADNFMRLVADSEMPEGADPAAWLNQMAKNLATRDHEAVAALSAATPWIDGPEGAYFPLFLRDFTQGDAIVTLWNEYEPARNIIRRMADETGANPKDLVKRLSDAKEAGAALEEWKNILAKRDPEYLQMLNAPGQELSVSKLNGWAKQFDGKVPFDEIELRSQFMTAVGEHVNTMAAKYFGVKPDSGIVRLATLAKNVQSIALMGINLPGYFVRNIADNAVTMWYQGIFGVMTPEKRARFWESWGGAPIRLEAGIGGAAGMGEDFRVGQAVRDAQKVGDWIDRANDAVSRFGQKKAFLATYLSGRVEKKMGATAYTIGTQRAYRNLWPKVVSELVNSDDWRSLASRLEAVDPELPRRVIEALRNSDNPERVLNHIFEPGNRVSLEEGIDNAAANTSVLTYGEDGNMRPMTPDEVRDALVSVGIYGALSRALERAEDAAGVARAVDMQIERARGWVDEQVRRGAESIAERLATRAQAEGLAGVLDSLDAYWVDLADFWQTHNADWDRVFEEAGKSSFTQDQMTALINMQDEKSQREWRRASEVEAAYMRGAYKGLGAASEDVVLLESDMEKIFLARRNFFDQKRRKYNDAFEIAKGMKSASEKRALFAGVRDEVNALYKAMSAVESGLQEQIDNLFSALVEKQMPGSGKNAASWRKAQRDFRQKMTEAMAKFNEQISRMPAGERAAAWIDFKSKVYNPMIAEYSKLHTENARKLHDFNVERASGAAPRGSTVKRVPIRDMQAFFKANGINSFSDWQRLYTVLNGFLDDGDAPFVDLDGLTSPNETTWKTMQKAVRRWQENRFGEYKAPEGGPKPKQPDAGQPELRPGNEPEAQDQAGAQPAPDLQPGLRQTPELPGALTPEQVRAQAREAARAKLVEKFGEEPQKLTKDLYERLNSLGYTMADILRDGRSMAEWWITGELREINPKAKRSRFDGMPADWPEDLQTIANRARQQQTVRMKTATRAEIDVDGNMARDVLEASLIDAYQSRSGLEAKEAEKQVAAAMALMDARADVWAYDTGKTRAEWYAKYIAGAETSGTPTAGQAARAGVFFDEDGRAVLMAMQQPNFSSLVHEIGHVFRRQMSIDDVNVFLDYLRTEHGYEVGFDETTGRFSGDGSAKHPTTDIEMGLSEWAEETFTTLFERYAYEGVAPTTGLAGLFEKFRRWMKGVYQSLIGSDIDINLTPEMRKVFDGLISANETPWSEVLASDYPTIPPFRRAFELGPVRELDSYSNGVMMKTARAMVLELADANTTTRYGRTVRNGSPWYWKMYDSAEGSARSNLHERVRRALENILQGRENPADEVTRAVKSEIYGRLTTRGDMDAIDPRFMWRAGLRDEVAQWFNDEGISQRSDNELLRYFGDRDTVREVVDYWIEDWLGRQEQPEAPDVPTAALNQLEAVENTISQDTAARLVAGEAVPLADAARMSRDIKRGPARANEARRIAAEYGVATVDEKGRPTDFVLKKTLKKYGYDVVDLWNAEPELVRAALERRKVEKEGGPLLQRVPDATRTHKRMTADEAVEYILNDDSFDDFTFRGDDFIPSKKFRKSKYHGDEEGEFQLPGVSSINIPAYDKEYILEAINKARRYGDNIFLLRGKKRNAHEWASDPDEVLMEDHSIVAIIDDGTQATSPNTLLQRSADNVTVQNVDTFEHGGRLVTAKVMRDGELVAYLPMFYDGAAWQNGPDGRFRILGVDPQNADKWVIEREDGFLDYVENESTPAAINFPVGSLDNVDPNPPLVEASNQAWRNSIQPLMEELKVQLVKNKPRNAKGAELPDDLRTELESWIGRANGEMSSAKVASQKVGQSLRDMALHNYSDRRKFDVAAGVAVPYEFWTTRAMLNWSQRFIDKPSILSNWYRLRQAQEKNRKEGPTRLEGKIKINLPFLPDWTGDGLFIDPMRIAFPFENFDQLGKTLGNDQNKVDKRAKQILADAVEAGDLTAEESNAATFTKNDTWKQAQERARQEMSLEIENPIDAVSSMFGLSVPLQWAYQLAKGSPEKISRLPMSRAIQAITGMMGVTGGVDIEAPLRKAAGLPSGDQWEDYRINRSLSNMAADGEITADEAQRAMIDRSGKAYEAAMKREDLTRFTKWAAAAFYADLYPEGEKTQRELQKEYYAAINAKDQGQANAVTQFYKDHPEYQARLLSLKDNPEEQLKTFLRSTVWDRWNQLGPLDKKEAVSTFGSEFESLFLSTKTRNYDAIDADTLAWWARALGGKLPKASPKGAGPDVKKSDPATQAQYQTYLDEKKAKFPNIDQAWGEFMALPESVRESQRQKYPQLDQYTAWKNARLAESPDIINLVQGDDSDLKNLPKSVQQAVYQFRAAKDKNFPNADRLQSQYSALPDEKRNEFLEQNIELRQYWDWQKQVAAKYPQAAPYIISEQSLSKAILGEGVVPAEIRSTLNLYYQTRDKRWPNLEKQQDEYFSLGSSAQKKAYLKANPGLTEYWDWRTQVAASMPKLAPYILSDETLSSAISGNKKAASKAPAFAEIQKEEPDLARAIASYIVTGEPLGTGARMMLNQLWEKDGKRGESLEDWVKSTYRLGY